MPIHVIANGELFQEAFNAIVTVLGTSTFHTAIRLSILFAVIGAALSYIKGRDLIVLAKWFVLYFLVTVVLLGPKVAVEIFDSSNPGAALVVDNVPIGLALPAGLITSTAHGIEAAMEEAFHMPGDTQFSKTGLLFGSRLFRLSTGFHLTDPATRSDFNALVKNCVIGDILINKKYSLKTLINSKDIWSTINGSPSPVRGVLFSDGQFRTCAKAMVTIKQSIDQEVENNSFKFFGIRIFGGEDQSAVALKLQQYLPQAYNYYAGLSQSAAQIMTQNVLINGIRDGVLNYSTQAGATSALLNLSSTQAMQRMRMAWGTSRNLATYVLPIMQVDILLLMLSLFPVIVLLTLQPVVGPNVFKHYLYSLLWVESWPILFSCLNLAVTFYIHHKAGGLAKGGLTLSNSNPLALEHSDVANMAGYLMTSVPFIAIGLVRGMAFAFNNAANYIGGMLHSTAAGAANEAVTGNISLGNTSYDNVNANKFDTNSTYMHGMATEQQASGATVMHTANGEAVWNVAPGISHLATTINASAATSASLTAHSETAQSAAIQDQVAYNHAVSDAASQLNHFNQASGMQHGEGINVATGETASAARHASDLYGLVQSVAQRNGVSWNETFRGMSAFDQSAGGGVSGNLQTPLKQLGVGGVGANLQAGVKVNHSRSSSESTGHDVGTHLNVSHEEMQKFSRDWNAVERFDRTAHAEMGHSESATHLSQLAADFREAKSASENYASNLSVSERLSAMANYSDQHSAQINSNFNQGFVDYVSRTVPDKADYLLGNTNNARATEELSVLANHYLHSTSFMDHLASMYQQGSEGVHPSQMYQAGEAVVTKHEAGINAGYMKEAQHIQTEAKSHGAEFSTERLNQIQQRVQAGQQNANVYLGDSESVRHASYQAAQERGGRKIEAGADKAEHGSLWRGSIKPEDIKTEETS